MLYDLKLMYNHFMKSILLTLSILYLLIVVIVYINQRKLIYHPTKKINHTYKEIIFKNNDINIHATVLNEKKDKAIIYFGGNAGNAIATTNFFEGMLQGYAIYFIQYRGYGNSNGEPLEEGLYEDALKIYDEIAKKHKEINVIGRSLGTGIATYLASKRDIHKMILVTPYDSIENIAKKQYSWLPVSFLLKDKFNSKEYINNLKNKTEILVITGEDDILIPKENTLNLVEGIKHKFIELKDTGHNNITRNSKYYEEIQKFL